MNENDDDDDDNDDDDLFPYSLLRAIPKIVKRLFTRA